MTKTIWHVCAFRVDADDLDRYETVCSRYFTTREAAHKVYSRGEKEIGVEYGIHWHIKMHALDAEEELDELIQEVKEEV